MKDVIIIGGGWAGCAASVIAKKQGANVFLFERTDMLLGLGNVGGIMRNNGRFTACEENIFLGAYELFNITDKLSIHKNMDFPGHKHAYLYDVTKIEAEVKSFLLSIDINIHLQKRVVDIIKERDIIKAIILNDGEIIYGDVFIDSTGSTGPMGNCLKYGNGCAMCVLRCPSFGPRISISQKAGIKDIIGLRQDGSYGAFSGSCKLNKDSLSPEIKAKLEKEGVVVLKLPEEDIEMDKLRKKVCQQYALKEYGENLILLDTGHCKMMTSYYPLEKLRKIKGLQKAKYEDPYSGGLGNSIRYLSMAPRENTMKVKGIENLFCAGEKAGLFVGHTEAITTGSLAGYNSVKYIEGKPLLVLPTELALGDLISYGNIMVNIEEGLKNRYTFSGGVYFNRMVEKGLYSTDPHQIKSRVEKLGLLNIYNKG